MNELTSSTFVSTSLTSSSSSIAQSDPKNNKKSYQITSIINEVLDTRNKEKVKKYQPHTDLPLITFCVTTGGSLHTSAISLIKKIKDKKKLLAELSIILCRSRYQFSRSSYEVYSSTTTSSSHWFPATTSKPTTTSFSFQKRSSTIPSKSNAKPNTKSTPISTQISTPMLPTTITTVANSFSSPSTFIPTPSTTISSTTYPKTIATSSHETLAIISEKSITSTTSTAISSSLSNTSG